MPGTSNVNQSQGRSVSNQTGTSGVTTAQTITIPAVANLRAVIRAIYIYGTAAATCTLVIQDNAVTKVDFGTLTLAVSAINPFNGLIASAAFGQAMQVVVGAGSAGTTTVSVVADYVDA